MTFLQRNNSSEKNKIVLFTGEKNKFSEFLFLFLDYHSKMYFPCLYFFYDHEWTKMNYPPNPTNFLLILCFFYRLFTLEKILTEEFPWNNDVISWRKWHHFNVLRHATGERVTFSEREIIINYFLEKGGIKETENLFMSVSDCLLFHSWS